MACLLAWIFAPLAASGDFPSFSLRRERGEMENPFQRPVTNPSEEGMPSPSGADHSTFPAAEADHQVRLASADFGSRVHPPIDSPEEADLLVSEALPYSYDLAFPSGQSPWFFELLPDGLIWHSYLAAPREPRIALVYNNRDNGDWLWDATLGGRRALWRFGNGSPLRPEGWELQLEGAALVRLNLENQSDVDGSDFRVGFPLVYGTEVWQVKAGYYHVSSHLGDEYILRTPDFTRVNYVRDALVVGVSLYPDPAWRLYGETGYALHAAGGAQPWELQFGLEYAEPGFTGGYGTPFFAANAHLLEEVDFGGTFTFQAGWLWRGASGSTFRTGFHFLTGKSPQFQFFNRYEEQLGMIFAYDF